MAFIKILYKKSFFMEFLNVFLTKILEFFARQDSIAFFIFRNAVNHASYIGFQ